MKLTNIHGGIHPKDNKYASADDIYIPKIDAGECFYVPFLQHRGTPAIPIVKKGQKVSTGEVIAVASNGVSVPIHSPINGIVTAITKVPHYLYGVCDGCIIEATSDSNEYIELDVKSDLAETIKDAGIIGMGGAGFPTWLKIKGAKSAETILLNGAECEPYLTCDYALMLNYYKEVLQGAVILKEYVKAKYVYIAIEHNKIKAAELLQTISNSFGVEVVVIPDKYPQGGEKQLIRTLLSKIVYQGKLPIDVGVLVHNVSTVKAIYDAVYKRKPFYERIVTISGIVNNPCNIMAKIGMTVESLFKNTNNFYDNSRQLIFGGPMTGVAITDEKMPIVKNIGAVLQLARLSNKEASPCIRCGKCVEACVMGLVPTDIERAYKLNNIESMQKLNIMNCIECGCCSYVCPANRPITQSIKAGKKRIMALSNIKDRK